MVTNMINNKIYIGQTMRTLIARKNDHILQAKKYKKTYFHKALIKYGAENFEWYELQKCIMKRIFL